MKRFWCDVGTKQVLVPHLPGRGEKDIFNVWAEHGHTGRWFLSLLELGKSNTKIFPKNYIKNQT